MTYFVENPDTSWWWRQRRWKRWRSSASPGIFRCCFCRFGTAWRKATRFATNSKLAGIQMMCLCKGKHQQLRGMHPTKKIPWTLVAQPYPKGLCRLLAIALCQSGWCKTERLNVSGCARVGSLRVGEASHPGPRRRQIPARLARLGDVQLLTPQTIALEARQLRCFKEWCEQYLVSCDLERLFATVPQFVPFGRRTLNGSLGPAEH